MRAKPEYLVSHHSMTDGDAKALVGEDAYDDTHDHRNKPYVYLNLSPTDSVVGQKLQKAGFKGRPVFLMLGPCPCT